jgi:hypothetical protein
MMLRFGEVLRPVSFLPVVCGPSLYFDQTEDTERIMRAFDKLRELALSPAETRAVLEETEGALMPDTHWFKSSYSSSGSDQCVEVSIIEAAVAVRDTKDRESGALSRPAQAWTALLTAL